MNYVDNYVEWLSENMFATDIDGNIEVTAPFLDSRNDYLQVYVRKLDEDLYVISDGGHIARELELVGMNMYNEKEDIESLVSESTVIYNNNEIRIYCGKEDISSSMHELFLDILKIETVFFKLKIHAAR